MSLDKLPKKPFEIQKFSILSVPTRELAISPIDKHFFKTFYDQEIEEKTLSGSQMISISENQKAAVSFENKNYGHWLNEILKLNYLNKMKGIEASMIRKLKPFCIM